MVHGRTELENAGSAPWVPGGADQVSVSYHWLDRRRNPIVWAGIFSPIQHRVPPGERVTLYFAVSGPMPPGRYLLSLDLVAEGRCWFSELGNPPLELEVEVAPRIARRALRVTVHDGPEQWRARTHEALAAQEEPLGGSVEPEAVAHLAAGCLPAPDWSRRLLDAHTEGFAAVGGSVEPAGGRLARRRLAGLLAPWAPGGGRKPAFEHPLLCPSVVVEHEPPWSGDVAGLPTFADLPEPWLYDGRIRIRVAVEALRT